MTETGSASPSGSEGSRGKSGTPPGPPRPVDTSVLPPPPSGGTPRGRTPPAGPGFRPKTPKMGGLQQVATDQWIPWTGGKPKADWTGLEEPNPVVEPNMYRPITTTGSKVQQYRIQGLSTKLTRTGDLRKFERNLMQRLVDYSMDTIAYLPSPADNSKLLCVVTDHG